MRPSFFALLLLSASCGYHVANEPVVSVSVPYVEGDYQGELTDCLVRALSTSSFFKYRQKEAEWIVKARIIDSNQERIGYRYDRRDRSGVLRKNIVGVEGRKKVVAEVTVTHSETGKLLAEPYLVSAEADYDYVDQNSLKDLSFVGEDGIRRSSLAFSLGQLDSYGAAANDAFSPVYKRLAQKIIEGLEVLNHEQ